MGSHLNLDDRQLAFLDTEIGRHDDRLSQLASLSASVLDRTFAKLDEGKHSTKGNKPSQFREPDVDFLFRNWPRTQLTRLGRRSYDDLTTSDDFSSAPVNEVAEWWDVVNTTLSMGSELPSEVPATKAAKDRK
jgi:hypothetical protein